MANFTPSPGVSLNEIDNTFLTSEPVQAGAAIVGPTVKGPIETPIKVTSYAEYTTMFGDVIESGSQNYSYLTSIAAFNYFNYGGESLLVTRVASGSFTSATSSAITNNQNVTGGAVATGSLTIAGTFGQTVDDEFQITVGSTEFRFIAADPAGGIPVDNNPVFFLATGSSTAGYIDNLVAEINAAGIGVSAIDETTSIGFSASAAGTSGNAITVDTGSGTTFSDVLTLSGGVEGTGTTNAFTLETISEGTIMNTGTIGTGGALSTGTKDNVRWEITSANTSSGTFSLSIRRGDDITNKKLVLESFNNLSLDPNSDKYITKVIGDQKLTYDSVNNQMTVTGEYPNNSRFVRVKSVNSPTLNYLDSNGTPASVTFKNSIPVVGNGVFNGAAGTPFVARTANFYSNINATDSQGLIGDNYDNAISLLSNTDDYKFNVLFTPGLTDESHTAKITNIITNTQNRGDNLFVYDTVNYGNTVTNAIGKSATRDSSYAATYWPWVRISDPATGKLVFVPASTMIPGVYAFNDKTAAPWFAPAGINRGGLSTVISAEYKLTQANRDTLYEANINPIATLPRTGVVVYGQKTLQKAASALDRVNVRRLLIELKSFIGQIAETIVFEQNTIVTRGSFLAKVNPYLEGIQQKQGLFAFKVIIDDSNNGPDVIDRNQLVGQIYIQPTRTAEFISLDFILEPTGAEFPG